MVTLHHGDCLDVLKTLPDNSIDSIVTDPPYGLAFMGKRWDYDVPSIEVWQECLRVLKPGGHLLAFAGTRTQHRMAVRIEDGGFEIRDCIMWLFGSGFPKSLDVSKALDKAAYEIPLFNAIREHLRFWRDARGLSNKALNEAVGSATNGCGMARHWTSEEGGQHSIPSKYQWRNLKRVLAWPDCDLDSMYDAVKDGAERPVIGHYRAACDPFGQRQGTAAGNITAPATEAAKQWQGWGTALKPAYEPCILARKPLEGTVAQNVQQWGVGGLNIDGCRVGRDADDVSGWSASGSKASENRAMSGANYAREAKPDAAGRWPANLIHDGSGDVLAGFPSSGPSKARTGKRTGKRTGTYGEFAGQDDVVMGHDDEGGSAARFFYCAKASKRDRDEGLEADRNNHPTVKPTELMRYLCRLITPPNGVVLDPFMGSGSTGKAAALEGFGFIGIEREAEYVRIASARIEHAHNQQNHPLHPD